MAHLVERSPILPVEFAGFRSDTYTLGRYGWKIAIEQDMREFEHLFVIAAHHGLGVSLAGKTNFPPLFMQDIRREAPSQRPPIQLEKVSVKPGREIMLPGRPPNMQWVDTRPRLEELELRELHELPLFATLDAPAGEQLIVDPLTVSEMLDRIREMQSPEMRAIRERENRRAREDVQKQMIHAQVVSLVA